MVADEGKLSPDQVNKAALCVPKGKFKGVQSVCGSHSKTRYQNHSIPVGSFRLWREQRGTSLLFPAPDDHLASRFNVDFPHMPVELLIKSSSILVFQSSTVLSCSIPSK